MSLPEVLIYASFGEYLTTLMNDSELAKAIEIRSNYIKPSRVLRTSLASHSFTLSRFRLSNYREQISGVVYYVA